MIVVNFAHPMTKDQLKAIEHLTGQAIEGGVAVRAQVNLGWPIAPHVKDLVDQCGLSGGARGRQSASWPTCCGSRF